MLQLIDISLKRGERTLFESLSCTVHPGQKASLTGRNGSGKSTLFELILGRLHPEEGDLLKPAGWRVAHMAQQVVVSDRCALDYALDGHKPLRRVQAKLDRAERNGDDLELAHLHTEYADVGGYEAEARAGEILHGLGFTGEDFQQPFRDFSGGWRIRLNLAQALMSPCDLLLLDEPTNHLDLDTTLWLESWLQRFNGTMLIIAHDRDFLDAVTDHTLHIDHGRIDAYRGNYSSFERQRADALAHQQTAYAKQQIQIKHMEGFINRFRAKASKARQAQSRLRALERMTVVAPVHAESPYRFSFANPDKISHPLISLHNVAIGYGDQPVLSGINDVILPGARIGVLGANGAGKST
ncbi:MAG: ABC-F family ATP-binding cassette domain-containing protein, partial [Gammaproteobacteria bacterium]|nr:ABC-F family ATP-binding cassette domain-containing protein [Gammaproteobacteria bacterium]